MSAEDYCDFRDSDLEADREPVKLEGWIKRTTDKAVLCAIGEREVWIPRSLLCEGTDVKRTGDDGTIVVPRWFAEQEDLTDE